MYNLLGNICTLKHKNTCLERTASTKTLHGISCKSTQFWLPLKRFMTIFTCVEPRVGNHSIIAQLQSNNLNHIDKLISNECGHVRRSV